MRRLHAATVLRTLVPQARVIFRLLAENQMAEQHDDDGGDKGDMNSPLATTPAWQHLSVEAALLATLNSACSFLFVGAASSKISKAMHEGGAVLMFPEGRKGQKVLARLLSEMGGFVEGAGMTFAQLFRMSRERLLVANDTALRSHLTEFKDHDLLQTRCAVTLVNLPGAQASGLAASSPVVRSELVSYVVSRWGFEMPQYCRKHCRDSCSWQVPSTTCWFAVHRRGLDGSDVLIIPVDDSTLQQILDDMDRHQ